MPTATKSRKPALQARGENRGPLLGGMVGAERWSNDVRLSVFFSIIFFRNFDNHATKPFNGSSLND
ncbi:MAG: hypothetical protein GXY53_05810 [Desulfobulbus sp.]|nr:hypothetical protein [Desulfobulbus sp.]